MNVTVEPHLPCCIFDAFFVIHNDTLSRSYLLYNTGTSFCNALSQEIFIA